MKAGELLERRRKNWHELEQLCEELKPTNRRVLTVLIVMGAIAMPIVVIPLILIIFILNRTKPKMDGRHPAVITRFAALYRAACADLALADAYQLPPNTVQYLHRLVGRAHNQLYQGQGYDVSSWIQTLFVDTPQRIFNDRCVQFCFVAFWGIFIMSAFLAHSESLWPNYAETVLQKDNLAQLEEMYAEPMSGRAAYLDLYMMSFYIFNNPWIGLKCFVGSIFIIPGMLTLAYNAAALGASFGYMFRPDVPAGVNFRHFVTAHGPFELTAIVLSAGAGLRIGVGFLITHGWTRMASVRRAGRESVPMIAAAVLLFVLAALVEAFISPSELPYSVKAFVAILSSGMLMFYFVFLGFPRTMARDLGF